MHRADIKRQLQIDEFLRFNDRAKLLVRHPTTGRDMEIGLLELLAIDFTLGVGAAGKAVSLDSNGNFIMPAGGQFGFSRAVIAAAGVDATDAAVLTSQVNVITGADGAKGVALPAAATTIGPILVINLDNDSDLKVYPVNGGNDDINGGAEDAAVLLRPGRGAWFIPVTATDWYVDPNALSTNAGALATPAGVGITAGSGTVYKTSVRRDGDIIKTSILIDLAGLASSTTDLDVIGVAGGPAHIGQIVAEQCGTILGGRMTCLEVPAGGADDIDLYYATEGTGEFDSAIGSLTSTPLISSGGAWTLAQTKAIADPAAIANKYLYLTGGEAGTAATYTAGKFLIELEGYDP